MNNEDKDLDKIETPVANDTTADNPDTVSGDTLADDIIRNDTIPETSKDTPGSNGAFPIGAFENRKD